MSLSFAARGCGLKIIPTLTIRPSTLAPSGPCIMIPVASKPTSAQVFPSASGCHFQMTLGPNTSPASNHRPKRSPAPSVVRSTVDSLKRRPPFSPERDPPLCRSCSRPPAATRLPEPQASTVRATNATTRPTAKFRGGNVRNDNTGVTNACPRSSSGSICRDSPQNPHPYGSADRSCWTLGTPFFPLVESGLDGVSNNSVASIADFKFGGAKQLAIGLGGHDACHVQDFFLSSFANDSRDALCFSFLFGGESDVDHSASCGKEGRFPSQAATRLKGISFPPTFQLLTPLACRP